MSCSPQRSPVTSRNPALREGLGAPASNNQCAACSRRPSVEVERRRQKLFDGFNGRLVCGGVVY